MGLFETPAAQSGPTDVDGAARQMESVLIQKLLLSSGMFHGSGAAGSDMYGEMFAGALAEAVTKSGGMGLAKTLEQSLSPPERANVVDGVVTSGFGVRNDPIDGHVAQHNGIDIGAPEGSPIRAFADGVVKSVGQRQGYGNVVEIDHGGGMTSLYAHASTLGVKVGQTVEKGQEIAQVGHTGRATGPHLHFELRDKGRAVDATKALKLYRSRAEGIHE